MVAVVSNLLEDSLYTVALLLFGVGVVAAFGGIKVFEDGVVELLVESVGPLEVVHSL